MRPLATPDMHNVTLIGKLLIHGQHQIKLWRNSLKRLFIMKGKNIGSSIIRKQGLWN